MNTTCLGPTDALPAARHKLLRIESVGCVDSYGAMLVAGATRPTWVMRKCTHNARHALAFRHGVEPPVVTADFGDWFFDNFLAVVPVEDVMSHPLMYGEWFRRWPLWKRLAFVKSERFDAIKPHAMKSMIKRELYMDAPSRARLIQFYPNLATQQAYAPLFSSLQYATFHSWRNVEVDGVSVTASCGMNNVGIAEWMSKVYEKFPNPHFIECDGKNWDATMQRFHHLYKLRYYRRFSKEFAKFVDDCFATTGVCVCDDGIMVYLMRGTVKSGHNDTTLGNTIINAAIIATIFKRLGVECMIIVQGDDSLVAFKEPPFEGFYEVVEKMYREFGIVPKGAMIRGHQRVSFISGCWYECGGGRHVFAPKLGKLMAKLWWTTGRIPEHLVQAYRAEVAFGLSTTCGLLPGYRGLLSDASKRVEGVIKSDKDFTQQFCEKWPYPVDVEQVGFDMMNKYDLSAAELQELDDFTYRLVGRPRGGKEGYPLGIHRIPLIDKIEAVDLEDPGDRPSTA